VVASAAKACPLRAVGIPVDPPCAAKELAEIIQATHRELVEIESKTSFCMLTYCYTLLHFNNSFQFSVQMCSEATGKRLESLSIPSRRVQIVAACLSALAAEQLWLILRVQPLVGPDLGALLAEHCPNLSTLCINSEKVLRLCHAKRCVVIGACFY